MGRFLPSLRTGSIRHHTERAVPFADPETKALLSQYVTALWANGNTAHDTTRPWPVERAVAEGFDRVMWVFKAVNTIATDSARLPYRLREDDDGDPLDDHPLYAVLNKKANPLETGQVFRKRLSAQVLLSKRGAFVEVTRSNGGNIVRLDLLPPGRTEPVPGTGQDLIDHWRLTLRDGQTREIDVDKVRWFRDPHPLDPYSGTTPLESAGMSVELDYFSRLYNVMFMRNDGRPGGVLAVDPPSGAGAGGDMDPADMDRIESRFGKGPQDAGKLSVISGKLSYADLAARPRDMQYGTTAKNSKIELLAAFGVAESVLGYAADRTFANAEQELYNYWTRTMPGHNDIIVAGFDEDSTDTLTGYLDVSSVEVLERAERAKREEARTEVAAGLRSIHSYVTLAGYADEVEATPYTRALYVPQGRTPLPATEKDAEALGLGGEETPPAGAASPGAPDQATPQAQPAAAGGQNRANFEGTGGPPRRTPPPTPARATGPARPAGGPPTPTTGEPTTTAPTDSIDRSVKAAHLSVVGGRNRRTRIAVERKAAPNERTSEPDERAAIRLEDTVSAALNGLVPRWVERTVARLESPKTRRGTRHWTDTSGSDRRVGDGRIDAARAVDAQRWADEAEQQTEPLVWAAAVAAATALLADLTREQLKAAGDTPEDIVAPVVAEIGGMVADSARTMGEGLAAQITEADETGADMDVIVGDVRGFGEQLTNWATNIAVQVATATTAAACDVAAYSLVGTDELADIDRTWYSRRDAKVRPSHIAADTEKQTRPLGEPFVIGAALLRYPGDPLGPPGEVYNCRCRLRYRARSTGRFVSRPSAVG